MKTIQLLLVVTLLTGIQINAQVTPIVKTENGSYIHYSTKLRDMHYNLGKSQSEELKKRVANEVKIIGGGVTGNDLDACFSTTRLNNFVDSKGWIMPILFFDQTGKVYAVEIIIDKEYFTFTDNEVQCILTKIMNGKLQLKFSNGYFNFYYKNSGKYRPQLRFVKPHEEKYPDLDEGQY